VSVMMDLILLIVGVAQRDEQQAWNNADNTLRPKKMLEEGSRTGLKSCASFSQGFSANLSRRHSTSRLSDSNGRSCFDETIP